MAIGEPQPPGSSSKPPSSARPSTSTVGVEVHFGPSVPLPWARAPPSEEGPPSSVEGPVLAALPPQPVTSVPARIVPPAALAKRMARQTMGQSTATVSVGQQTGVRTAPLQPEEASEVAPASSTVGPASPPAPSRVSPSVPASHSQAGPPSWSQATEAYPGPAVDARRALQPREAGAAE